MARFQFTKHSRLPHLLHLTTTSFNTWLLCTPTITLPCTKDWHANQVHLHLSTGRPTVPGEFTQFYITLSSQRKHKDFHLLTWTSWYPLTGGAQDYSYVWAGTMEITIEMSCCKYPPAAELPTHWNEHRQVFIFSCQYLPICILFVVCCFHRRSSFKCTNRHWCALWEKLTEAFEVLWPTCLVGH